MLPIEKVCRPCRDERGFDRAIYKVVDGIPMCGGCVADMPSWCDNHLKQDPPRYMRSVAFRGGKNLCKKCLDKEAPEPKKESPLDPDATLMLPAGSPTVAQMKKDDRETRAQVIKEVAKERKAKKEEAPVRESVENKVDWKKLAEERKQGATVATLADKYGVSIASIYKYTGKIKRPRASAVKTATASSNGHAPRSGSLFDHLLEELRKEREKIDAAIKAIEQLG